MTKISVYELEVGMVLHDDVFDANGLVLIGSSTIIDENHIAFLMRKDIQEVAIKANDESKQVSFKRLNKRYDVEEKYQSTVDKFKLIYNEFKVGKTPVFQEIHETVEPLYDAILNDEQFTQKMWQIQAYDDYTFDHSVRVSMISGLLAKWYGLSAQEVKDVALAGLLHDIGKCNVPDQILNKPGPLTPEEFKVIKTHATLGYILIKDIRNLSYDVLLGVLQHHERIDGTGYPNGLVGSQINTIAKIVAVADVYCAMTGDRVYKQAMHPFEVASFILEKCYKSLDFSMAKTFLSNISHFYIGHKVRLSNEQIGEVVMTYKDDPARPLIRVGEEYYDLRKNISIEIVEMIED